mmetsp:Transcript_29213/g.74253  ORF Transcript_29213/g.74253 Transcript_29213/m.74253 type:complete len:315 (+) Transcript_29213:1004-1948(+)
MVRRLELVEDRTQEADITTCQLVHRFQVSLDDGTLQLAGTVGTQEPRCRPAVVLRHDPVDVRPGRVGVQPVHPALTHRLLELCLRQSQRVVRDRRVRHGRAHVLEAVDARRLHGAVDGLLDGKGPRDSQLHPARFDTRLLLSGQHALNGGEHCLHPAPGPGRIALVLVLEVVGLVEQHEGSDCGVPAVVSAIAQLKRVQGEVLPILKAIKVGANPCVRHEVSVIAWKDVHAQLLSAVKEATVGLHRIVANGVIGPHRVATQVPDDREVVAPLGAPLGGVASLQQILRWDALTAAVLVPAGQCTIRNTTKRVQGW